MTYGLVRRDISKKLPSTPEELLQYFRKELLDSYRQCREVVNRLVDDIDNGFVHLGDVIIREVAAAADLASGPALSDPAGSFALTPTGVYFKNTLGWIFLGPLTAGDTVVTETAFGQAPNAGASGAYSRTDHTHGTPVFGIPSGFVTPAMTDGSLVTDAELVTVADMVQEIFFLLQDLVRVELGQTPEYFGL